MPSTQRAASLPRNADAIPQALSELGVDLVFAVQGGAALPIFHALGGDGRIRVVATAHEQGAAFAADGFARAAGRPGVCVLTSGPGALNALTALGSAYMDSVPVLALTGQVPSHLLGTDAFQEAEVLGMSLAVTKDSRQVSDPTQVRSALLDAYALALHGRTRPVLVDLPKDITGAPTVPQRRMQRPLARVPEPTEDALDEAARVLSGARRPLIMAGHGVLLSGAQEELTELSARLGAPVTTTLLGLGAINEDEPLALGMLGMHGTGAANSALGECDVLIAVGARLDDRATGRLDGFAPQADLVHIDIDASELGKNRRPRAAVLGDAKLALRRLLPRLPDATDRGDWANRVAELKARFPLRWEPHASGQLLPQQAIEMIGRASPSDAVVVAGVGQHQMWAALHFGFRTSHTWLTSGGLGAMGYALPAAIGAQFAAPQRPVVVLDGDGCFHMTSNELATAVHHRLPLKVFVINNGNMGMVRQWVDLFHEGRQVATDNGHLPSFARLAQAYGAHGLTASTADELRHAVREAFALADGPVVVDVRVVPTEDVYPMVPPGRSNSEFLTGAPNP